MMDQTVNRKPNKTFNIIKNEMEEKTKKKNKLQSQVFTYLINIMRNGKSPFISFKR